MSGLDSAYIDAMREQFQSEKNKPKLTSILDSNKLNFTELVNYLTVNSFCKLENTDPNLHLFNKDLEIFNGLDNADSSILSKIKSLAQKKLK